MQKSDSPISNPPNHDSHLRSLSRMRNLVRNLMDLLPTLKHLCENKECLQVENSSTNRPVYTQVAPSARPYVHQIHDKFPSIDSNLADRLGEANWQRFRRLLSLNRTDKSKATSLDPDSEEEPGEEDLERVPEPSAYAPISEFQDSGLGTSVPAASKYAASVASHTSFLSTQSAAHRGAVRAPPTPIEVAQGRPFQCFVCAKIQSRIKNRADWKYVCSSRFLTYYLQFQDARFRRYRRIHLYFQRV